MVLVEEELEDLSMFDSLLNVLMTFLMSPLSNSKRVSSKQHYKEQNKEKCQP